MVDAEEMETAWIEETRGPQRRQLLPAFLFVATCLSTFWAGTTNWMPLDAMGSADAAYAALARNWQQGLFYAAAVMGVLMCHEMGHFLTAMRNRIPTSWPYFLPLPAAPLGTLGAIIGMQGLHRADRRQIFDVGLAGPLAGLVVAIPMVWIGAKLLDPAATPRMALPLPNPWLFQAIVRLARPDWSAAAVATLAHGNAFLVAGWAAMLVTGLNMVPMSQLDGGHVAHALLGRRSVWLARGLLLGGIAFMLLHGRYTLAPMLVLITLIGVDHPPTADDRVWLGWPRLALGWPCLLIPVLCFPLGLFL
jgi:membrane-associated protease RseP (regulator of RpoE activity)